ncbi:capsular polysaccharide export protein, LipB/KpsS family [Magnetospirillum molischianum]|uniref:capsular polysaccharide export protein, LipB/KpsS family n=1 Tax=Magnetospirillum molischianum TaxID=1083 RepID=UPI00138B01C6|nr:hypothetical protein [Magnetospirillum molischianum]
MSEEDVGLSGLGVLRLSPWQRRTLGKVVAPSPLEFATALDDPALLERAAHGLRAIVEEGVGGVWWEKSWSPPADGGRPDVLVLIESAAEEWSDAAASIDRIYTPDRLLVAVQQRGPMPISFAEILDRWRRHGATVLTDPHDPWSLFPAVQSVHSCGGSTGFLALLAGKSVVCHCPTFFSGWGLTQDALGVSSRSRSLSLIELFAAHALLGTRYYDPYDGQECCFEEALAVVRRCRALDRINRGIGVCVGMAFWKRRRIAEFVRTSAGNPRFTQRARRAVALAQAQGRGIAVWASREPPALASLAAAAGVPLIRVEDGFIRSSGLGADFIPPASITLDASGLYYDPSRPSDLERLLETITLDEATQQRTRRLIELMVSRNITKYAGGAASLPTLPPGRILLVPGQVEDDRSVLLGGAGITSNLDLLRRVRAANPEARILYKPHPDVDAGHRRGAIVDDEALLYADLIVRSGAMADLIRAIDEVHCLTSLAGFEALLRGKKVTVYGHPFYAGWGLTTDVSPPPRRRRQLTLEELVAGTLLFYPRYLDPLTGIPCGPETVIARFSDSTLWRPGLLVQVRRIQGRFRRWLSRTCRSIIRK